MNDSFRQYLKESVWTDAKKKFSPNLVDQFETHFKERRIPPNINIQKIKSEKDILKYVECAENNWPLRFYDEIKKDLAEGNISIFQNNKCRVSKISTIIGVHKVCRDWCISNDEEIFDEYFRESQIFVVETLKEFPNKIFRRLDVDDRPYYIFPICIIKGRESKSIYAWDSRNNDDIERDGHDKDWIKKYATTPLGIPLEVFK